MTVEVTVSTRGLVAEYKRLFVVAVSKSFLQT